MKRRRKIIVILGVVVFLCVGLLWATKIFYHLNGLKLKVVDANGMPLTNVFVVYQYYGHGFGVGHPGSITKSGSVLQTDKNGRFKIPSKIFFRTPLMEERVELEIHAIWSSETHSRALLWKNTKEPETVKGIYEFLPKEKKLVLHDLTDNPREWLFMMEQMRELVMEMDMPNMVNVKAPKEVRDKLESALRNDERLFKDRHSNTIYQGQPGDRRNGITYGRLIGQGIF